MRTLVTLDDDLVKRAAALSGIRDTSALVEQALLTLIEQETKRGLSKIGGTDASATSATRDRDAGGA
jgi:Arc/MetJ family transcription regulator